jgi:hypothetical protein
MKNRNGIKNTSKNSFMETDMLMFMGVKFPNRVYRELAVSKVLYDQALEYSEARSQPLNT